MSSRFAMRSFLLLLVVAIAMLATASTVAAKHSASAASAAAASSAPVAGSSSISPRTPAPVRAHTLVQTDSHGHKSKKSRRSAARVTAAVARGAGMPTVAVHQTAANSDDRITRKKDLQLRKRRRSSSDSDSDADVAAPAATLSIDRSDRLQTLVGFGGAITEAAVTVLAKLPDSEVQKVIDAYYSESGNRYSLGRLHINSCDFSVDSWSFDNVTDDFALQHFDTALTHEQQYLLPFLGRVLKESYHDLQLFASPWSPPAWMKSNDAMTSSYAPGLKSDERYHDAWARYLSKWFTSMKAYDVPFWGMTVQNEPEYAAPWEACLYTAEQQRDFVRDHLGPVLKKDHPEINIIIFDHNKDHVVEWADTIYSDKEASQYVWGIGVHWYSGDEFDHLNTTHQRWPAKGMLATEATNAGSPIPGSVTSAEKYAHDILGDLNNFVQGWTDWNIVLDAQGGPNHLNNWCDAPIIADTQAGSVSFQPMFYYLGHFSRFLPPGAVRLGNKMQGDSQGLEWATFLVDRKDTQLRSRVSADDDSDSEEEEKLERHGKGGKGSGKGDKGKKQRHSKKSKSKSTKHSSSSSSSKSHSSDENSGADVVVVVMNPLDREANFDIAFGKDYSAIVTLPAHSIQTLTFDADLI